MRPRRGSQRSTNHETLTAMRSRELEMERLGLGFVVSLAGTTLCTNVLAVDC